MFVHFFSHVHTKLCSVCSSICSAIQFNDTNSISRYLARVAPALGLYGTNSMEQTEVCFLGYSVTPQSVKV